MPIVQNPTNLVDTVNEDYLCLGRYRAEQVLDSPGADDDALTMATYVLALVAEIRRLDALAGKHRKLIDHRPNPDGTYNAMVGPGHFIRASADEFQT